MGDFRRDVESPNTVKWKRQRYRATSVEAMANDKQDAGGADTRAWGSRSIYMWKKPMSKRVSGHFFFWWVGVFGYPPSFLIVSDQNR